MPIQQNTSMIILYRILIFLKLIYNKFIVRGGIYYLLKIRLEKLKSKMKEKNLDAIFISKPENMFYISGFTGEGFVIVMQDRINLFTDFRYMEQAKKEASETEIIDITTTSLSKNFKNIIQNCDIKNLGIESDHLTIKNYYRLKDHFRNINLIRAENIIEELRIIKDSKEITAIKKAQEITDKTFLHIIDHIRPGVTELEIASEIDYFMKKSGAETSFKTIVVSGKKSSLPHGVPSGKKLEIGDTVTIDFGAKYAGYCSDMTRTIFLGKPSKMQEKIFNIVLEAQEIALEYIKSGILGKDIDKKARKLIEDHGFGKNFGHSLGHGVGIEIHEEPKLSKKSMTKLMPGMVVTVEPGIYIENSIGVRIEDLVVVTEKGCKNLTSSPKYIIIDV